MPEALRGTLRTEGGGRGSRGSGVRCGLRVARGVAARCVVSGLRWTSGRTHKLASITSPGETTVTRAGALSARKRGNAFWKSWLAVGLIQRRTSSFAPHRLSLTAPLTHVIHVQRRDGARSTAARGLAHATAPLPAARAHQAFRSDSALSICSQTPFVAAAVPG